MNVGMDHPLRPLTSAWSAKVRLAYDSKRDKFQRDADEAMKFFNGPYDWMYDLRTARKDGAFAFIGGETSFPQVTFAMTVNKAAELVQLFGPALYHRNPIRQVNPRKIWAPPIDLLGDPNDPMVQAYHQQIIGEVTSGRNQDAARASLYERYLNYTPEALDLKTESRTSMVEAIIKGMGVLWPEVYQPAGLAMKMAGSFHDSVDNLLIDPDAECLRDAKWVARRCVHPYWEVERTYGLEPDSLKGRAAYESIGQQADVATNPVGEFNRQRGLTNDLLVYWKIWSKMGAGGRLSGAKSELKAQLDDLGEYCYLVIADGCGYPLNLRPEISAALVSADPFMAEQAMSFASEALAWPTPFWADDAWPFVPISFHSVPRSVWPMSHLRPGMGELKFLNWAYSMLASKIRVACRDFLAIVKSGADELKEQIKTGPDYTMLEIDALHGDIDKVVKFLQHPNFNRDIYEVIERISDNFEKRTGLTELMYGLSAKQLRSAAEADMKGDQVSVRPDDMANKVEEAMTDAARKEAFVARWHLEVNDVAPILGPTGAQFWQALVLNEDPTAILHGLEFRIEAGSARKPNKGRDAANMQQAMQNLFAPLYQYAATSGDIGPVNALITGWAKSIDLDAERFLLKPPPPPMPAAGPRGPMPPLPRMGGA